MTDRWDRRRCSTAGAALIVVAVLAAACSSSGGSAAKSPITIALVADLTGTDSASGQTSQAGVETAVAEINASGGVNGAPLRVSTYDTQSAVGPAQAAIRAATTSKPAAITGILLSTESTVGASIISSGGVPWVSESYPTAALNKASYWFTTSPTDDEISTGTVESLKSIMGGSLAGKKVAFEGTDLPAVKSHISLMSAAVTKEGGTVSTTITDQIGLSSWASQAQSVVSSGANAFIINADEPDTAVVAKALSVAGFRGPILSTESSSSDSLLSNVNLPNFYVVRETVDQPRTSAIYRFVSTVGANAQNVNNPNFGKEYIATYVIAAVLTKCGATCPVDNFVKTLRGLGDISIPNNISVGPLNFATVQSGVTAAQAFAWDSSKGMAVSNSQIIDVTP